MYQVGNAASANLHVVGLRLQSRTVTLRTGRLATIACQHHAILNLILVLLHHVEEGVNRHLLILRTLAVAGQSVPQHVLLALRQRHVGFEDGEIVQRGTSAEFVLPVLHLLAVPAYHAAVIY